MNKPIRQGDVLLYPIDTKPEALELVEAAGASGALLAVGETSNHSHRLFGSGAKLMRYKASPAMRVVVVESEAEVRVVGGESVTADGRVVPRHEPIALPAGTFELRIQRSYADGYSRQVAD